MYRLFYPRRDATLYEKYPTKNTGIDQILEVSKIASGSPDSGIIGTNTYNTRILIDFGDEITTISQARASGLIGNNAKYYLNLRATNSTNLPISYSLEVYAIGEQWVNGTGTDADTPITTNGASWQYRSSENVGQTWTTAGTGDITGSNGMTNIGGGTWIKPNIDWGNTSWSALIGYATASKQFNYESPDLRVDVTNIVNGWLQPKYPNYGFLVKRPDSDERSGQPFGELKFFSKDTNTIYVPRLEVAWDTSNFSGTSSFTEISSDSYVIYFKNIRSAYRIGDKIKFRLGVRPQFPVKTYTTGSFYLSPNYRLPTSSYYSVLDTVTNETIIPYDTTASKISCDSNGNYIDLQLDTFQPERYYKLALRVERDSGNDIQLHDDGYYFKVVR